MFEKCLPIDDPTNQWKYCPSVPAAIIFFVLFGCSTLAHIIQAIKHRKPFCFVIIMGGLWETLSFATRVLSTHEPSKKGIYDASFLLLIISPLLINAFDYMLLGRMVRFFLGDAKVGGISGSKMGVIFVCFDIISFIVQIGGGLMSLSKKAKTANLGLHVYTGGVVFQQLLIICFLALTISFQRKLKYYQTEKSSRRSASTLLIVLRASLCLISYRIIFRVVEFSSSQGTTMNIYINHHEFFVYAFDAVPMFFALLLMNIWHPGRFLQEDLKVHCRNPSQEEGAALQPYPYPQPYDNYGHVEAGQ